MIDLARNDTSQDLWEILRKKQALLSAIERGRSGKWCLQLWSRFIRARDAYRCLCCDSVEKIQAHHIVRKSLYPWGAFETGNGIVLCRECHTRVHAQFNGRPDLNLPLGAEQGDDQDEWAFLFGLLRDDASARNLNQDEFYFLDDHMLRFFVSCQGYENLYKKAASGEMSRIRFAHEIWRVMPEKWYENVIGELIRLNF